MPLCVHISGALLCKMNNFRKIIPFGLQQCEANGFSPLQLLSGDGKYTQQALAYKCEVGGRWCIIILHSVEEK